MLMFLTKSLMDSKVIVLFGSRTLVYYLPRRSRVHSAHSGCSNKQIYVHEHRIRCRIALFTAYDSSAKNCSGHSIMPAPKFIINIRMGIGRKRLTVQINSSYCVDDPSMLLRSETFNFHQVEFKHCNVPLI